MMPTGMILLLIVAALVYFGVAHRILDRMRLTDAQALVFIGLMIAGSFIDIPIMRGEIETSINVGGALIPLALAIYLFSKSDSSAEKIRSVVASLVTAAAIFAVSIFMNFEPANAIIDPIWLFGLIGGVVGYLSGRSRRAAFIAGTVGIIINDVVNLIRAVSMKMPATVAIGGAGIFDTIVLSGLIAVALAELVGETRERIQGGPENEDRTEMDLVQFDEEGDD